MWQIDSFKECTFKQWHRWEAYQLFLLLGLFQVIFALNFIVSRVLVPLALIPRICGSGQSFVQLPWNIWPHSNWLKILMHRKSPHFTVHWLLTPKAFTSIIIFSYIFYRKILHMENTLSHLMCVCLKVPILYHEYMTIP